MQSRRAGFYQSKIWGLWSYHLFASMLFCIPQVRSWLLDHTLVLWGLFFQGLLPLTNSVYWAWANGYAEIIWSHERGHTCAFYKIWTPVLTHVGVPRRWKRQTMDKQMEKAMPMDNFWKLRCFIENMTYNFSKERNKLMIAFGHFL